MVSHVEWRIYVHMTYVTWCGAIHIIHEHKPRIWGLQLTLVSEWQRLFNNQGPQERGWNEDRMVVVLI